MRHGVLVSDENAHKMANAFDVAAQADVPAAQRALIERREKLLGPAYRLFYAEPLHIVRGEGVWLYDASGAKFLDAYNNVTSVGHCHPHVVEAITRQAATLATHTRYLHEGILNYAERLLATFPAAIVNATTSARACASMIANASSTPGSVSIKSFMRFIENSETLPASC